MRRLVLIGFLFANASVFAQTENSDVFALGGGLHGLDHTTWTYEVGFIYEPATHFGIGLAYNNEGHLPDNHRDGLAAQAWYVQSLSRDFEVQLGTGPYLSMNNTTVDGVRENDFEVGVTDFRRIEMASSGESLVSESPIQQRMGATII